METLQHLLLTVTPLDALALALFLGAWFGYSFYADRGMDAARGSARSCTASGSSGRASGSFATSACSTPRSPAT